MSRIPLSVPHLAGNEEAYLAECVTTNFVSSVGPLVGRFESAFADFVDAPHAVACSSGTAALHVALRLAGAGPDKLVATSTFTFIASANAARYTGADLLLVDSEPATWNLDTERLYDEVRRRAAAGERIPDVVEVVHVLGHPARIEPMLALRDEFGIAIVEDAAESLGAVYRTGPAAGRQAGTIGDFGCFSFNGNKVMTTGNGGMIVTSSAESADRARHLTTQAKLAGREYAHDDIGYNYRLTNLAAALGLAQLEQLPGFLERKRAIAERYARELRKIPLEHAPHEPWAEPSFWLSSVLLGPGHDRDAVLDALDAKGVEARPLWCPIHLQEPYRSTERIGAEVAEDLYARGLSLPSSVGLSDEDQERVITVLAGILSS